MRVRDRLERSYARHSFRHLAVRGPSDHFVFRASFRGSIMRARIRARVSAKDTRALRAVRASRPLAPHFGARRTHCSVDDGASVASPPDAFQSPGCCRSAFQRHPSSRLIPNRDQGSDIEVGRSARARRTPGTRSPGASRAGVSEQRTPRRLLGHRRVSPMCPDTTVTHRSESDRCISQDGASRRLRGGKTKLRWPHASRSCTASTAVRAKS